MQKLPLLSEHDIQAGFVSEVGYKYRLRGDFIPALFYAAVNGFWAAGEGGRRNALIQKYFAEGYRKGIPDIHYDQPRGCWTKLVIEFKREDMRGKKDGGLKKEQKEYIEAIEPYAMAAVCYTAEEAMAVFGRYMDLRIAIRPREDPNV